MPTPPSIPEKTEPLESGLSHEAVAFGEDSPTLPRLGASPRRVVAEKRDWPEVPEYEILGELGRGGVGVVYKARDLRLGRLVALKMLGAVCAPRPETLARFRAEAESIARLRHPNIIQVYEINSCSAGPYFAMELAEGGNLAELWQDKPQPPRDLAALVAILARAIHAAHLAGIVHRDLKPANVLLASRERESPAEEEAGDSPPRLASPKVTDFGLAKRLDEEVGLTVPGQLMGTPGYMAPEQIEGRSDAIGTGTDIYALGVLLYEGLTGTGPYRGASSLCSLHETLTQDPLPPSRLRLHVPHDLETICLHCLEREPERRYHSALALAEDLERWLDGKPIHARPTPAWERAWKWARRNPTTAALSAALVVLVLTALVVVTWLWGSAEARRREADEQRATAETLARKETRERQRAESLAAQLLMERGIVLCEAGQYGHGLLWLARSREATLEDDTGRQLALDRLLGAWGGYLHSPVARVNHGGAVQAVSFTPDGKRFWTGGKGGLRSWDSASGKPADPVIALKKETTVLALSQASRFALTGNGATAQLLELPSGKLLHTISVSAKVRCGAFSVDGSRVLVGCEDGLASLWSTTTGQSIGQPIRHQNAVITAVFHPKGQSVLTACQTEPVARLWHPVSGAFHRTLEGHMSEIRCAAFSPQGETVATGGTDNVAILWNPSSGVVRTRLPHLHHVESLAFSADGTMFASGSGEHNVRIWRINGEQIGEPVRQSEDVRSVAFSPNGRYLLTGGHTDDNTATLWEINDAGKPLYRRTEPFAVTALAVSPDSRTVAIGTVDQPEPRVRLYDRDKKITREVPVPDVPRALDFTRDGRRFLVGCYDGSLLIYDTASLSLVGSPIQQGVPVLCAAFSPDGRSFLVGCEDGNKTVRQWEVESGKLLRTLTGHTRKVNGVAFSPDGRLAISASWDFTARVWDLKTGELSYPPLVHDDLVQSAVFSPDGKLVLTAGDDYTSRLWRAEDGTAVAVVRHPEKVQTVAFHPDGSSYLVGSRDGKVRLWETLTSQPLGQPWPHRKEVHVLAFAPDGKSAWTSSLAGEVCQWAVPEPVPHQRDIALWLRASTGLTLDSTGHLNLLKIADQLESLRRWQSEKDALRKD
jgi:WD40 repeat protein